MIKVLVVEDNIFLQRVIEEKLQDFNDIIIKETAANGKEAISILENNHVVDIILMDIEMPIMNGIEATLFIKNKYPQIKIIMLTVFDNDEKVFQSLKAGADGYLLKDVQADKIYSAIKETLNGGAVMSPSIALKTLSFLRSNSNFNFENQSELTELTSREIEVLEQLSKGLKNKDIAANLFVSVSTIKKHIENIYKKLQVHNRIEMLQIAKQNRLL